MDGERTGARINEPRAAEAVGTGATTIATACPFCTVMLNDGVARLLLERVRPRP